MQESKTYYNPKLRDRARSLRKNLTKAEACLWKYVLRASNLEGYSFRRQRPVGEYIADFMCISLKLIIEVDGITHSYETVAEKDEIRQKELEDLGFQVVRFTDEEVLTSIDRVRNALVEIVRERRKEFEVC